MGEWIKCSERLPPDGEKVLVWFPKNQHIEDAVFFEEDGALGYSLFDGECLMSESPTHWQPLPEPPHD